MNKFIDVKKLLNSIKDNNGEKPKIIPITESYFFDMDKFENDIEAFKWFNDIEEFKQVSNIGDEEPILVFFFKQFFNSDGVFYDICISVTKDANVCMAFKNALSDTPTKTYKYYDLENKTICETDKGFITTLFELRQRDINDDCYLISYMAKRGIKNDVFTSVMGLNTFFRNHKVNITPEELFSFLNYAINSDEMNSYLESCQLKGISLTENEKYSKFFELNEYENILLLYKLRQSNNNDLGSAKKKIK